MKICRTLIIILLLLNALEANNEDTTQSGIENNKTIPKDTGITINMLIKPGWKKIKQNILLLESRKIGVYGFDLQNDNKKFDIDRFFHGLVKVLEKDVKKIKNTDLINVKKLIKAENKYSIYEFKGIKYREKIKEFFKYADMNLMITGSVIFKNNELTILLKFVDKKRLTDIIVLNKKVKDEKLFASFAGYFKKEEKEQDPDNYTSPVINKDGVEFILFNKNAGKVMVGFKGKDNKTQDQIAMKKDNNGFWRTKLQLDPGKYQYHFIVDGNERFDPKNPFKEDDGYAGIVSVVEVR